MVVQEHRCVPRQIRSRGKALSATKVTKLHLQLQAAPLRFKLQNWRMSPKNKHETPYFDLFPFQLSFCKSQSASRLVFQHLAPSQMSKLSLQQSTRQKKVPDLWLEQMFDDIVPSLLLLPVKLKVKVSFHHKNNDTSTPQRARASNLFRSKLV